MNSNPGREPDSQVEKSAAGAPAGSEAVIKALAIIVIGLFLLLYQLGMFPHGFIPHLMPSVFILGGLWIALQGVGISDWGLKSAGTKVKDPVPVIIGATMAGAGVVLELNFRGITHIGWEIFWPLMIIGAGAGMLGRHFWPERFVGSDGELAQYPLDMTFVFSGTDRQFNDQDFQGGKITAVFGGFKIDLTRAGMRNEMAVLKVTAVYGGGEIRVPDNWLLDLRSSAIFGGVEDKTRIYRPDPSQPTRKLIVRATAVFGGIVIRN